MTSECRHILIWQESENSNPPYHSLIRCILNINKMMKLNNEHLPDIETTDFVFSKGW